ncbi:MAG: ferrochelatase [Gammaproteobacteria bacterium]|nr:ferrochelatase [Gammaproteobacteria bacterium]
MHTSPTGILLSNLGSPDEPTTESVRRYLKEFLSDPKVVNISRILWLPILHGIILRTRPQRSAKIYKKIWTDTGSPLINIAKQQRSSIQNELSQRGFHNLHVRLGMRYGRPSLDDALRELRGQQVKKIILLPLYPQYAESTTASTIERSQQIIDSWLTPATLHSITDYHDNPAYITALANSIRQHWAQHGHAEKLLFSFHGIPKRASLAGDPYHQQCLQTAQLIAQELNLDETHWLTSFQSRFGRAEWITPYTDQTLKEWGQQGIRHVQVICPGFSADCLETLEEIEMENREYFIQAGGQHYEYIPALNDGQEHIKALCDLIEDHLYRD